MNKMPTVLLTDVGQHLIINCTDSGEVVSGPRCIDSNIWYHLQI